MRRWRRWLVLAALLLAASRAPAAETVRWVVQEAPPHLNFPQGRPPTSLAELDSGALGSFLRLLLERLPDYRFELIEANNTRVEQLARSGETVCTAQMLRTPQRLEWMVFTPLFPVSAAEEFRVVARAEQAGRWPGDAKLRLAELLQQRELRLLVPKDRHFNPQIDELLNRHSVPRLSVDGRSSSRLMDMVRHGRADLTIEYASIVRKYLGGHDAADGLVSLPFVEGAGAPVVHAACSRTARGRALIEALDAAVREMAREDVRASWLPHWRLDGLDPPRLKRLQAYLDERAKGGPRID